MGLSRRHGGHEPFSVRQPSHHSHTGSGRQRGRHGLVALHLVVMRPPFLLTLLTDVGRIYELAIPLRPNRRLVIVIISGYHFREPGTHKPGTINADPPKEISI